jgi:hypothetical protein
MNGSGRSLATVGILGALWMGAGALAAEEKAPGDVDQLEKVLGVRAKGNDEAVEAQKQVDAISDETDDLLGQYRTVLKQIDSIDLYNSQMQDLLTAQENEIVSLTEQVGRVQEVGRSVTPLMLRMVDAIEQFVALDVPFLIDERTKRMAELRKLMGRADVNTSEKFRHIMEAYQIENEYGRTIEAYRAPLLLDEKEVTVDFLRFGRIALIYQSLDESQTGRWDQESRSWMPLDSSHRSAIRAGLRIARKQAAPDLIRLPLRAPTDATGKN